MSTTELGRAVDTSTWDAGRAMAACESASDYNSICAGRKAGDPALRSSHALPHHYLGKGPNAAGVRNALSRLPQTEGLTNTDDARSHLEAHMREINPDAQRSEELEAVTDIVRALAAPELVAAHDGSLGTLRGDMATFGDWASIRSTFENGGRPFVEQIARGSFAPAFERDRGRYQPLYDHGQDPSIARKPLGPVKAVGETARSAYYEVTLLDTDYNRALLPGLEAGLYGSSFRGDAEITVSRFAERAEHNPEGLDEHVVRSITRLKDFGPTPFPVGTKTSAVVARSMTDEYVFAKMTHGEGLQRLAEFAKAARPIEVTTSRSEETETEAAPAAAPDADDRTEEEGAAAKSVAPAAAPSVTPDDTGTEEQPHEEQPPPPAPEEASEVDTETKFSRPEDVASRKTEVLARQAEIAKQYPAGGMEEVIRSEWDGLKDELADIERREQEIADLQATVARSATDERRSETVGRPHQFQTTKSIQRDIFDPVARWKDASSPEHAERLLIEDAQRAVEIASIPTEISYSERSQELAGDSEIGAIKIDDAKVRAHVSKLVRGIGPGGRRVQSDAGRRVDVMLAEHILGTGSPAYQSAFGKLMRGQTVGYSQLEEAALQRAFTLGTTGVPVVWTLDPTIIRTSNYVINPFRAISRLETIVGTNEWRGATSGAVVATRNLEGAVSADATPAMTQPAVQVQRVDSFVPFSREVGQDWEALQAEMAGLFAEAKDIEEATSFLTGNGTNPNPQGLLTALTTTQRVQTGTTGVFALADLYNLQNALPPRARSGVATFLASLTQQNRIRAIDTAGGAGLWVQLQEGVPPRLAGMGSYELSTMTVTLAGAGNKIMVVGDFSKGFMVVDRVGMEVEVIPNLFQQATAGTGFGIPTGQRGVFAFWRNSCRTLDVNRFRYLETI